jgi:molecular chaperone DnaJ
MAKDYYKILGVARDANVNEIKSAYRKLAHKFHPDKGGDAEKFKEINEAYQVLSNQEKRSQYDRFGQAFEARTGGGQGAAGFGGQDGWFWGRPDTNFDVDFGDLGDMMEEMFGFNEPKRKKDIKKGKDIRLDVEISLEESYSGVEKEFNLARNGQCVRCGGLGAEPGTKINECFSCRGTGQVQQIKKTFLGSFTRYAVCPECGGEGYKPEKPCNVCKGEGRVKEEKKMKINISAGVDSNQTIRVEGGGEAGKKAGRSGDLYLRIFIKTHRLFERKGDDLFVPMSINMTDAALGAEIKVSTIEGKDILLNVPAGTPAKKVFRVTGKGMPHFRSYGRGDMYVDLEVGIPKKLSRKQKELLENLKEEGL